MAGRSEESASPMREACEATQSVYARRSVAPPTRNLLAICLHDRRSALRSLTTSSRSKTDLAFHRLPRLGPISPGVFHSGQDTLPDDIAFEFRHRSNDRDMTLPTEMELSPTRFHRKRRQLIGSLARGERSGRPGSTCRIRSSY